MLNQATEQIREPNVTTATLRALVQGIEAKAERIDRTLLSTSDDHRIALMRLRLLEYRTHLREATTSLAVAESLVEQILSLQDTIPPTDQGSRGAN